MKMAEFGRPQALARRSPDNACDAAAKALKATAWGG